MLVPIRVLKNTETDGIDIKCKLYIKMYLS